MKLCDDEECKCEFVQMCSLCKHCIWDYEYVNTDPHPVLTCDLKNDFVKGFSCCEKFECYRLEDIQ